MVRGKVGKGTHAYRDWTKGAIAEAETARTDWLRGIGNVVGLIQVEFAGLSCSAALRAIATILLASTVDDGTQAGHLDLVG